MKPRWCSEHSLEFKQFGPRNNQCPECYNRKRRSRYALRKENLRAAQEQERVERSRSGKTRAWRVRYNSALKQEAFAHYGMSCPCGESEPNRLALDHVDDNGHAHRLATRLSGVKLYSWLKTHGWPPGYQVLCHNCNILKRAARYASGVRTRKQIVRAERELRVKFEVVTRYGNGAAACVQCGFDKLDALTIDHINNDGHLTRRQVSPGYLAYLALQRSGYPSGYQTLCFCCNMEKEILLHR